MSALNDDLYPIFSNPYHRTVEDIIAVGGELDAKILQHAYEHGIFPWPHEGYPLLWFAPGKRGIIDFDDLHLPRSFKKWIKKNDKLLTVKFDSQFQEVVRRCRSQPRQGQNGTWINDEIEAAYFELFKKGSAFSCEIFRENALVGGIYGVRSKNYCSCESMFHTESNTSKFALYSLIQKLKAEGQTWIDIQMVTEVCESLGGELISKKEFLKRIGF